MFQDLLIMFNGKFHYDMVRHIMFDDKLMIFHDPIIMFNDNLLLFRVV